MYNICRYKCKAWFVVGIGLPYSWSAPAHYKSDALLVEGARDIHQIYQTAHAGAATMVGTICYGYQVPDALHFDEGWYIF